MSEQRLDELVSALAQARPVLDDVARARVAAVVQAACRAEDAAPPRSARRRWAIAGAAAAAAVLVLAFALRGSGRHRPTAAPDAPAPPLALGELPDGALLSAPQGGAVHGRVHGASLTVYGPGWAARRAGKIIVDADAFVVDRSAADLPGAGAGNLAPGNPASGNPASGNPASGNPAPGNPASGNPAPGNPASGNPAPGNLASGAAAPGDRDSGKPASSHPALADPAAGTAGPGDFTHAPRGDVAPGPAIAGNAASLAPLEIQLRTATIHVKYATFSVYNSRGLQVTVLRGEIVLTCRGAGDRKVTAGRTASCETVRTAAASPPAGAPGGDAAAATTGDAGTGAAIAGDTGAAGVDMPPQPAPQGGAPLVVDVPTNAIAANAAPSSAPSDRISTLTPAGGRTPGHAADSPVADAPADRSTATSTIARVVPGRTTAASPGAGAPADRSATTSPARGSGPGDAAATSPGARVVPGRTTATSPVAGRVAGDTAAASPIAGAPADRSAATLSKSGVERGGTAVTATSNGTAAGRVAVTSLSPGTEGASRASPRSTSQQGGDRAARSTGDRAITVDGVSRFPFAATPVDDAAAPAARAGSNEARGSAAAAPGKPGIAVDLPRADAPVAVPPAARAPVAVPPAAATPAERYAAAERLIARDPGAARAALRAIVAGTPDAPEAAPALLDLARLAAATGDDVAAKAALAQLSAHPAAAALAMPAAYLRCTLEHTRDEYRTCLAAFRVAFPDSPRDAEVLAGLAIATARAGDCASARPLLDESMRRYPKGPSASDVRAWRTHCEAGK